MSLRFRADQPIPNQIISKSFLIEEKVNSMRIILLILAFQIIACGSALAQTVTGTVTDASTGAVLPGVNIKVKGTTTGTSTDADGKYSLQVHSLQDTLVFSFIGYQTQSISMNGRTTANVALKPSILHGKQMVVVGYGEQKKADLTGVVSTVEGSDISNQPAIEVSSALQGKIAGVTITQHSGQPGLATGNITIRGIGTLGSSTSPLVLIDGVEGFLSDVDPSNVASVTVLKDAASAAIYGSRAANGVILVKTKHGKKGAVKIHYNGYVGWQHPTDLPKFVDAGEYMKYYNMANKNLGRAQVYSDNYIEQWQKNHLTDPDHYPNTDWVNAVFTEPGLQQKHHLSVSGGSDKVQYYSSLGYDENRGNIIHYGYKRYSIRLNTNINASKQWHFIFDVNAVRKNRKAPTEGTGIIRQVFRLSPNLVARYSDGSFGPGHNHSANPVAFARRGGLQLHDASIFKSRLKARYEPLDGLEFSIMYSPEYRDGLNNTVQKQINLHDISTPNRIYKTPQKSSISESNGKVFNNNLDILAKYHASLQNHQFKVLGGYEFIDHHSDHFSAYRDHLALREFTELNSASVKNQQNSGTGSAYALQSVFGRFNYNYKSTYLFQANVRYDGSSRFAKNYRYGLFPSFSAGWRLANEPFFKNLNPISKLKLRVSWGELGNQDIGTYPYQAVVNLNQRFIFGGQPVSAAAQLDMANTQISWETTEMADIGLNLGLWQNRFNFSFDYYQKKTRGILLRLPIPMYFGLTAPYQNAGKVENKGWELSTSYKNNAGDFHYDLSFHISNDLNKVTDLHGTGPSISGNYITKVGKPLHSLYGYVADGFFDSKEEIQNSATQSGKIAPGDIKYENQLTIDTNEDGVPDKADDVINADDKKIIGNTFPKFTYGFNIAANYKGFDLSASFQGVGKKDVLLTQDAVWAFYNGGKMREWQKDFWTPDNKDAAYPRLTAGSTQNSFKTSSFWVYSAAYLRLRNLRIGYSIPVKWAQVLSIEKIEIYFMGQNLFTWLDDMPPGVSPNVPNTTNGKYYPVNKVYTFGLSVNI
jgi:TonB-linked SusC/RagA family outer membrane protein